MTDPQQDVAPDESSISPVNVIDGIPDRSSRPAIWKYALLAVIFLAWVGFLIYCYLAGNV